MNMNPDGEDIYPKGPPDFDPAHGDWVKGYSATDIKGVRYGEYRGLLVNRAKNIAVLEDPVFKSSDHRHFVHVDSLAPVERPADPDPEPTVSESMAVRVGRRVDQHIYRGEDPVGFVSEPGLAVELVNAYNEAQKPAEDVEDPRDALLANVWLYVSWKSLTSQLTTEQRELWADAIERVHDRHRCEGSYSSVDRWWRDEA